MEPELRAFIARREAAIAAVRGILIDNLHIQVAPEAIDPDAPMFGAGLALDSVDALELVVAAETRFAVSLPQDALRQSLRSVNTMVDLLLELQDEAGARAPLAPGTAVVP
jgi:acyl carrier protein